MSKKANPTLIGVFIVAGLALIVGAILLFGSAKLFKQSKTFVLYFDASVTGLSPGAPVKFRGVTVGAVEEVLIRFHQAPNDLHMPVLVTIDPQLLRKKTDGEVDLDNPSWMKMAVDRGFRGVLESQSFVTGLLYVELRFVPGVERPVYHQQSEVYPEIPTAPTRLEELMNNLSAIDLKGLTEKIDSIFTKLDNSLSALKVDEINAGVTNLLGSLNTLMKGPEVTNTLAGVRKTLDEYRSLAAELRTKIDPLAEGAEKTLQRADETLVELRGGLENVKGLLAPNATLRRELNITLEQLSEAAQAVSGLADFLTRHPNAILSGRKTPAAK